MNRFHPLGWERCDFAHLRFCYATGDVRVDYHLCFCHTAGFIDGCPYPTRMCAVKVEKEG